MNDLSPIGAPAPVFRRVNLTALVDDDLSPILERYEHLAHFLTSCDVDPYQVAAFFDDNNTRLRMLVDRIAEVPHES